MNDEQLKQIIAELIHSQGVALALIVSALARQVDAQKLTDNLRALIASAQQQGESSMAVTLATHALAAAEAQTALQNQSSH